MSVALITHAPYATYDHPKVGNRGYWRGMALYGAVGLASAMLVEWFRGASTAVLWRGLLIAVGWPSGLWVGLSLGYRIKEWAAVLARVFGVLQDLSRPLAAFAFGYAALVVAFGALHGAVWKLDSGRSFSGLGEHPSLGDFVYFSLITAATVGYGDVVPRSPAARIAVGAEIVLSVGWTLVVFTVLMSIFAKRSAGGRRGRILRHDIPVSSCPNVLSEHREEVEKAAGECQSRTGCGLLACPTGRGDGRAAAGQTSLRGNVISAPHISDNLRSENLPADLHARVARVRARRGPMSPSEGARDDARRGNLKRAMGRLRPVHWPADPLSAAEVPSSST
jgi:hypothetical protein